MTEDDSNHPEAFWLRKMYEGIPHQPESEEERSKILFDLSRCDIENYYNIRDAVQRIQKHPEQVEEVSEKLGIKLYVEIKTIDPKKPNLVDFRITTDEPFKGDQFAVLDLLAKDFSKPEKS